MCSVILAVDSSPGPKYFFHAGFVLHERQPLPDPFLETPMASDCTVLSLLTLRTLCAIDTVALVVRAVVMVLTAVDVWLCRVLALKIRPVVEKAFAEFAHVVGVLLTAQPFAVAVEHMHID